MKFWHYICREYIFFIDYMLFVALEFFSEESRLLTFMYTRVPEIYSKVHDIFECHRALNQHVFIWNVWKYCFPNVILKCILFMITTPLYAQKKHFLSVSISNIFVHDKCMRFFCKFISRRIYRVKKCCLFVGSLVIIT